MFSSAQLIILLFIKRFKDIFNISNSMTGTSQVPK